MKADHHVRSSPGLLFDSPGGGDLHVVVFLSASIIAWMLSRLTRSRVYPVTSLRTLASYKSTLTGAGAVHKTRNTFSLGNLPSAFSQHGTGALRDPARL